MHLLPAERSDRRIIDGERVCEAIAAITCPPAAIRDRAKAFAVLGDPTRLTLRKRGIRPRKCSQKNLTMPSA